MFQLIIIIIFSISISFFIIALIRYFFNLNIYILTFFSYVVTFVPSLFFIRFILIEITMQIFFLYLVIHISSLFISVILISIVDRSVALSILQLVNNSEKKSISEEDLNKFFDNESYINNRINNLKNNNFVFEKKNKLFLTKKGEIIFYFIFLIKFLFGKKI